MPPRPCDEMPCSSYTTLSPVFPYFRLNFGPESGSTIRQEVVALTKAPKSSPAFIDDPQRCEICGTTLTLYPKDFAPCPHCHQRICRQCWGPAWPTKAFTPEVCAHMAENEGLTMNPVQEKSQFLQWDWQKAVFALGLGLLAVVTVYFLINLFVF